MTGIDTGRSQGEARWMPTQQSRNLSLYEQRSARVGAWKAGGAYHGAIDLFQVARPLLRLREPLAWSAEA